VISPISPDELGSTVVLKNPDGGHVYLRDVATIETGFARKTFFARADQKDCLPLGIAKSVTADSRAVVKRIREALPAFQATLPPGVGLRVYNDASDIISSRLSILTTNLGGGVILVFLVLWVVVGLRNSFLAIIGIPFSFCCALICMHVLGVTVNAISLVGLVLCAGMIVDDAIVVLENIYRLVEQRNITRRDHAELLRAIREGAGEVFWPVIVSSATTVAAFLPLLLMTGMVGQFFAIIPKTVTVVLLASLFECLLILPVHYVDFGRRMRSGKVMRSADEPQLLGVVTRFYDWCLSIVLRHRYVSPLPILAMGFLAYAASPLIDVELFPSDMRVCMLDVQTADEASLDQTGEAAREIERIVLSLSDRVSGVLTSYGLLITEENAVMLRNNVAQMHIQLQQTGQFDADPTSVITDLRERIDRYLAVTPNTGIAGYRIWAPRAGPPTGKPVYVRIECPDFRTSKLLAEQYKASLAEMDGVFGIKDDLEFGRQQLNLEIDEDRASVHGLTFLALASALRTANDGLIVSVFKDSESGEDLDVRLRLDDRYCRRVEDLLDLDIRTPAGYTIQLGQIASVKMDQGYAAIPHHDGLRAVTVSAEVDSHVTTAQEVNERLVRRFAPVVEGMTNVNVVYGGQFAETASSFASLREAYVVAFVMIYFLLATQFRSYLQPLVILSTAPFACIGVVAGLLLSGYPFTVMTFIGVVGMTGVVVNDSILLVDCANAKRHEHDDLFDAVRAAGSQRLRPILLTTVTTVFGLLPLALGLGGKSRIWSPFASSFAWGLTFATLITLFLVPTAYCIAQDLIRLVKKAPQPELPRAVQS
jgi:HAE1 family hydrophobic/amphiphilic exporter-1